MEWILMAIVASSSQTCGFPGECPQQRLEAAHVPWCVCAKSLQLCLTLCNPMNYCPPGSSVHGILQARILEWVSVSSSRGSSQPRDWTCVSYISSTFVSWKLSQPVSLPIHPLGPVVLATGVSSLIWVLLVSLMVALCQQKMSARYLGF